jgi:hypothetical protein
MPWVSCPVTGEGLHFLVEGLHFLVEGLHFLVETFFEIYIK